MIFNLNDSVEVVLEKISKMVEEDTFKIEYFSKPECDRKQLTDEEKKIIGDISNIDNATLNNLEAIIPCKHWSKEDKIKLFQYCLNNKNILQENIIVNLFNILKSYNTFTDEFFALESNWFSDLEEFFDIQIALQDDIKSFIKEFTKYYLGLFVYSIDTSSSLLYKDNEGKIPQDVAIPYTIYALFMRMDFLTIKHLINKYALDISLKDCYIIYNDRSIKILKNIFARFLYTMIEVEKFGKI
jgi:hypothetical protein